MAEYSSMCCVDDNMLEFLTWNDLDPLWTCPRLSHITLDWCVSCTPGLWSRMIKLCMVSDHNNFSPLVWVHITTCDYGSLVDEFLDLVGMCIKGLDLALFNDLHEPVLLTMWVLHMYSWCSCSYLHLIYNQLVLLVQFMCQNFKFWATRKQVMKQKNHKGWQFNQNPTVLSSHLDHSSVIYMSDLTV
jgi:hypothetical protein